MRREDIESMKNAPVPEHLAERISDRILAERNKGKTPVRRRPLAFAGATLAIAAVFVVGVLATRPASAARIEEIHAAFSRPLACTIRSYQVSESGDRRLVGRTEVDGARVQFFIVGRDGKERSLEPALKELKEKLDKLIAEKPAREVAQPGALEKLLKESAQADAVTQSPNAEALSEKKVDAQKLVEQITQLTSALKDLVELLEKASTADNSGAMVAGGKSGPQYIRQLLGDEELWERREDITHNGETLNHFVLKGGLERFSIYVQPSTKLPVMSRLDMSSEIFSFVVEDIYEYRPLRNQ